MKYLTFVLTIALAISLISCSSAKKSEDPYADYTKTPSGLLYKDLMKGSGMGPSMGKKVTLNYIIKAEDGSILENTYENKFPMSFKLGNEDAIKGLEEGIMGMMVGGKRIIVIPPDLGFGSRTVKNIPANSTLTFEVELLKVE